jgi:hypothetical protein
MVPKVLPIPRKLKLTFVYFLFYTTITVIIIVTSIYPVLTVGQALLQTFRIFCSYLQLA